jgi:lipoprotein-anchoring transpeptidase ErfK/SrfK
VAATGAVALLAAACAGLPGVAAKPPGPAVRLAITPGNGSANADPGQGVTVTAANGRIRTVAVTGGPGQVSGSLDKAGTAWRSTWALHPASSYTVTATGVDSSGKTLTKRITFRTVTPQATLRTQIFEGYQQTYGVGMPIILTFSHPVTNKAQVERSLQLWTSKPVTGAWYWDGDSSLVFRPRLYWPENTQVRFTGHLDGVQAASGVYGTADLTQSFQIGSSLIAVGSTRQHNLKVYYHGKLFADWPASMGGPGDDTANGTYLTVEKQNPALMSGPGYHNFPVPYSVRFTFSGNYIHDAYWSVGQQGFSNVSHGCVNLSPAHATTYYHLAIPGDPVTITGSPVAGKWDDGWTEWFLTWQQLLHGSATGQAVEAGPSGSTFVAPSAVPDVTASSPLQGPVPGNFQAG